MKIGDFVQDQQQDHFVGKIVTRTMRFPHLIMRRVAQVLSERAAAFEIFEVNSYGEEVQVGAVWERRRRSNQEIFLVGLIDDPSFSEGLQFALFGDEQDGYAIQWRREREPFDTDSPRAPGNGSGQRGGGFGGQRRGGTGGRAFGGFAGGSTAGPGGEYLPAREDLDDQVPF